MAAEQIISEDLIVINHIPESTFVFSSVMKITISKEPHAIKRWYR